MIRRLGELPRKSTRYVRRPGAYAILIRNGACLLTHQMAPFPEFQLPGGGIDPGESQITALHREVFEETGWSMAEPRHVGTFRRFADMPEYNMLAEKICHIFVARPVMRRGLPSEPGHSAVWMPAPEAL